jgi:hypothetical protein
MQRLQSQFETFSEGNDSKKIRLDFKEERRKLKPKTKRINRKSLNGK